MAILDQRINSRNIRTTLTDVYGVNPFDKVKQLNKPLESVLGGLKDLRRSLGKVQDVLDKFKGIKGQIQSFSMDSITKELVDALGLNIFKQTIDDIKAEAEAIMSMLGINSSSSIDRAYSMSSYATDALQDELDTLLSTTTTVIPTEVLPPVVPTPTPTTPTPSVTPVTPIDPGISVLCTIPAFVTDTSLLDIINSIGIMIDTTDPSEYPGDTITDTKPVTPVPPVDTTPPYSYPVVDTVIVIAIICISTGNYGIIAFLPDKLKDLLADILMAMGLDTNNIDAIIAAIQYGNLAQLLETYEGLLDRLLQLAHDIQAVMNILNDKLNVGAVPAVTVTTNAYANLQTALPTSTSIIPLALESAIQALIILAIKVPIVTQRKYYRTNYLHTYYPRNI